MDDEISFERLVVRDRLTQTYKLSSKHGIIMGECNGMAVQTLLGRGRKVTIKQWTDKKKRRKQWTDKKKRRKQRKEWKRDDVHAQQLLSMDG
eukprot:307269_1